jgi:uncharacterized protein (TIGR02246 family)
LAWVAGVAAAAVEVAVVAVEAAVEVAVAEAGDPARPRVSFIQSQSSDTAPASPGPFLFRRCLAQHTAERLVECPCDDVDIASRDLSRQTRGWQHIPRGHGMHRIVLALAIVAALTAPAFAQKAEIESANTKWVEFFSKGDFAGIASLYTVDATAFPPGSAMVRGRDAIAAMWKGMAEQVSDPKLTTHDVKLLGPAAALEIGTFSLRTKGPTPNEVSGKYVVVWEKVGSDWKLAADIWNDGK